MRILNLAAGEKWTGIAAVAFDQTAAMVAAGLEAQFGFVRDSPLAQRLRGIGWARPLFERPPRWPGAYIRDVRHLRATICRERFDIVHTHGSHDHWVAAAAAAGTGVVLARTIHRLGHVPLRGLSRALMRRTQALAFANSEIAKSLGRTGPIHSPVVDTERFHPASETASARARFGFPADRFLIGTVGKMAQGRGHRQALETIARLPESIAGVHVGHGELLESLKRTAQELAIGGRTFWTGYQEETLPDLYRSWDAFLFTASGSEQGQRAILEAMASGLPVVALDLPGVRDLLTDGREGFIVKNDEELASRLAALAQSRELAREMSLAARRRAFDFTAEAFAENVRAFYETITSADRRIS